MASPRDRPRRPWKRRRPELGPLHRILREHLATFLARAEDPDGRGLPRFVRRELLRYLACGVLALGFARVQMPRTTRSWFPTISGDGKTVAFESIATDLVLDDANGHPDVFVHDLTSGQTTLASVSTAGAQATSYSSDASLSHDGRFVVYESFASNLVPGDTNSQRDIFITDFLGPLACPPPAVYCTSKATSIAGCLPTIGFGGTPSMAAGSGFDATAGPMPGGNPGLFIDTTSGHVAAPIVTAFGSLCLTPGTIFRIGLQAGVGNSGVCDGQYTVDFNQYAATQSQNPALVANAVVDTQLWYRGPPSPGTANLTNAGRFLMCP